MLVVGENINASNKTVGQAIANRDAEFIAGLARKQAAAGADFIDVNAGTTREAWGSPEAIMEWLVEVVQSTADKPLAIDSDLPSVIGAGLGKYQGDTVMINSVNAEVSRLHSVGRLAAEHRALLVALAMGEGAIPKRVEERLAACVAIMSTLKQMGISEGQVFFDPLVLPISVDTTQAIVTLKTIQGIKSRFPAAKTIVGLSNISYGLPNRDMVNRAFLTMAVAVGLDAAILNPLDAKMMSHVKMADMLMGKDPACRAFIRAHREGLLMA